MALDKLVDSTQLDADLTSVANAIRTKGGTSAQLAFPQGFVDAVEAIEAGGITVEDLFNMAWPSGAVVVGDSITTVQDYALAYRRGVESLSIPNAVSVGTQSFIGMTALRSVDLPKVQTMTGRFTFSGCSSLRSVNLPELTTIDGGSASAELCTFQNVAGAVLNFPKLTTIVGLYAFRNFGTNAQKCTVVLPSAQSLGRSDCFRNCNCQAIDLGPDFASLPLNCFYQGGGTQILILRRTAGIVTAAASSSLSALPSTVKVYVPQALIESYKTATNWSTKGDIFYPIEGSIYETQYADGTPIA